MKHFFLVDGICLSGKFTVDEDAHQFTCPEGIVKATETEEFDGDCFEVTVTDEEKKSQLTEHWEIVRGTPSKITHLLDVELPMSDEKEEMINNYLSGVDGNVTVTFVSLLNEPEESVKRTSLYAASRKYQKQILSYLLDISPDEIVVLGEQK